MARYIFLVQQLCGFFEGCEFHHVPRAENEAVDALSKLGSTRKDIPAGVSLENIHKPSIKPSPESESIFILADLKRAEIEAKKVSQEAKGGKAFGRTRGCRVRTRGCCRQLGD